MCLFWVGYAVWFGSFPVPVAFRSDCGGVRVRVRVTFTIPAKHISIFSDRKSDVYAYNDCRWVRRTLECIWAVILGS